jgi:antirestriction protein
MDCDVALSDIAEAYQGQFNSDEAFTIDLLDSIGDLPQDLPSYIHIDWERTARDVMMDYSESNGHYFRNL